MEVYRVVNGLCITHDFGGCLYNTEVWKDASALSKAVDGGYYKYYLAEPDEQGVYQPDLVALSDAKYEVDLAVWKVERAKAVSEIVVEHNSIMYDGDEVSQGRIGRTWPILPEGGTIPWVAADDSVNLLTADDLKYILFMAGTAQSAIWSEGRPKKGVEK